MMGTPIIHAEQALLLSFLFIRISAILIMMPVIGDKTVPLRVKAGLALLISLLLAPSIPIKLPQLHSESGGEIYFFAIAMCGEALIGIVIGFAARIIFMGVRLAGDIIGTQIGFSIANVIDPASNTQVSVITQFQYMAALVIFLAVDAHHTFIIAIAESYRFVSPFDYHFSGSLIQHILIFSNEMFVTAVKICAPVMAVILFTNVGLGVMARTVPQINIFIVGFPLQICVGLIILALTSPFFAKIVQAALLGLGDEVRVLLRLM